MLYGAVRGRSSLANQHVRPLLVSSHFFDPPALVVTEALLLCTRYIRVVMSSGNKR